MPFGIVASIDGDTPAACSSDPAAQPRATTAEASPAADRDSSEDSEKAWQVVEGPQDDSTSTAQSSHEPAVSYYPKQKPRRTGADSLPGTSHASSSHLPPAAAQVGHFPAHYMMGGNYDRANQTAFHSRTQQPVHSSQPR
ncbi:hypothetical protein AK812_SmicGene39178 [Symbiodinium microadriaticum]|uniref:Uncharacterized protein n=1 Tax=Symbiodinium microadriaticum TaxID=2951 RepID=A0A1Q9CBW1_SYMMI|nr:hypothetical protein AK812_SmicGene39178 [Symbiodinium microadriaticum]